MRVASSCGTKVKERRGLLLRAAPGAARWLVLGSVGRCSRTIHRIRVFLAPVAREFVGRGWLDQMRLGVGQAHGRLYVIALFGHADPPRSRLPRPKVKAIAR